MIEVFKTLNGLYDKKATEGFFTINERDTRRNSFTIVTKKTKTTARQKFFYSCSHQRLELVARNSNIKRECTRFCNHVEPILAQTRLLQFKTKKKL